MGYTGPKDDLNPEGEKKLHQYIKQQTGHDFVFVTDYPAHARAFYHMRYPGTNTTKSFDLLWNGLEVTTGAQREHRVDKLVAQAEERGVDINGIRSYVDFFKHGCPPHGGCGFGLTRMLMNITGLENVREVTFVYRGPTRLTP
jgi:aspartyl-tRNA synthetase